MSASHETDGRWWSLGDRWLTIAFWGAVAILVSALFRSRLLPFVDYPQHLALAATLRRVWLLEPAATAIFETNLLGYNSLFHVAVAAVGLLLPVEIAGKVVLSTSIVLTAAAVIALLDAAGRPRPRALLAVPILTGFAFAFGFANFNLSLGIQLFVLARVLRGEPSDLRTFAITAGLALLGVYAHLFASALSYLLMLVVLVVGLQTGDAPFGDRLRTAFRTGAPLLPAIAYALLVQARLVAAKYQNFEYATTEGDDVFALSKVRRFLDYCTTLRADRLDALTVAAVLLLLFVAAVLRDERERGKPSLAALWCASVATFLVLPHVFWATNFIFERVSFLVVLTSIAWTPPARAPFARVLDVAGAAVAVLAALVFLASMDDAARELRDVDTVLSAAPPGRRMVGLVFNPRTDSFEQRVLLHVPAYYVARHGGEVAFSFTRTMSLPVHYRAHAIAPTLPTNFELNPETYDRNAPYGRYFDLVLTKWYDPARDPRSSLFAGDANVRVLAHEGAWWLLDTRPPQ